MKTMNYTGLLLSELCTFPSTSSTCDGAAGG